MNISIVIPTYRRPGLLLRCIDALTKQDFPAAAFEVIVVSDGPDEQTKQAVEDYQQAKEFIRFLSLSEKKGPAAARNYGWKNARYSFVLFTDDDCIPDRQWITAMWSAFQGYATEAVAFSGKTVVPLPAVATDYERNIAHLEQAEFITANCACTKSALEKTGGFDEAYTMAWREDSDFQFRLMTLAIPIVKAEHAIVVHPVRKAAWGVSIKEERKGHFNALLYKKFPTLYRERIQSSPPWLYYILCGLAGTFVISAIFGLWKLFFVCFASWLMLTFWFTAKRLRNTSRSWNHMLEMAATSAVIPFLSLYWRWYGAIKFRTPLLP